MAKPTRQEREARIGLRFGSRVIVSESKVRTRSGLTYVVQCDCGDVTESRWSDLRRTKNCVSCGHKTHSKPFKAMYNRLVSTANKRGLECSITYDDYVNDISGENCHYCESEINWTEYGGGQKSYFVDRKDNEVGYTKDNSVPCCTKCNYGKSDIFSYEEWVVVGNALKSYKELKTI